VLSLWRRKSLGQEPRWNADSRAPQQMVCADLRKLVCGEARPCPMARQITHCVCRRFASDFYFFRSSRSSLPDKVDRRTTSLRSSMPGNPCRSDAGAVLSTGARVRRVSMDHRVKPGGDESETWLAIARMRSRIARTDLLTLPWRGGSHTEGARGGVSGDEMQRRTCFHPLPLAEPVIGRRFAPTRWLATPGSGPGASSPPSRGR
jgi:hypothetical protein